MNPLISAADLKTLLQTDADVLVCDCSFELGKPDAGVRAFEAGHIPGAVYLHLDDELSAPKTGRNGRHPLPDRAAFAQRMAALGLNEGTTVIACDAAGGAYASRLWWMLLWIGHANVRVLDGGLPAWLAAGGALETGPAALSRAPGNAVLKPSLVESVEHAALRESLGSGSPLIVDARAADRFRGENETIDPVAGHIPGALNRPFRDNLGPDGTFKPAAQLRADWLAVMGGREPADVVQHCGSGVTACHNLLAMAAAGLPGAKLYPGSWSEWIAQPGAPIATGA